MDHQRIALITGANQGVGLQVAKELVSDGVTVLLGSRSLEKGREAAASIGERAIPIQIDVTDAASISAAAARIETEFGRLDLLVNNAGISTAERDEIPYSEFAEAYRTSTVPLDKVRTIWETNVFGPLAVYQAMLPLLKLSSDARIVNVGSAVGSLALALDPSTFWRPIFNPGYCASKAAMNAMVVAMMIEQEGTGIKINTVSPGYTKTALNDYQGTETIEEGSREVVRVCRYGPNDPSGTYTMWENQTIPW